MDIMGYLSDLFTSQEEKRRRLAEMLDFNSQFADPGRQGIGAPGLGDVYRDSLPMTPMDTIRLKYPALFNQLIKEEDTKPPPDEMQYFMDQRNKKKWM